MRRMVLGAALLALLAVGCKAELNLGVVLEADGTGTLVAETGFDEEFREFAFQGVDPQEAIFEDNDLADLEGATYETYERGEFTFYTVSVPFDDIDEVLAQAGDGAPVDELQVSVTEDEVRVEGRSQEGAADLLGGEAGAEGFSPDLLADTIAIHLRLTMPGKVTEHNADRVLDDGTLEWDVPLTGEALDVLAVSDPKASDGGGFPLWLAGVIGVVVVGAAGAAVALRRRNRGDQPAPDLAVPVAVGAPATDALAGSPPVDPPSAAAADPAPVASGPAAGPADETGPVDGPARSGDTAPAGDEQAAEEEPPPLA